MEMTVTLQKRKPGKAIGTARCHSIATDDATQSRLAFLGAAQAVAQRGFLTASRPLTRLSSWLSQPLLFKKPLWAIPDVSIREDRV